jgi:hypothetical protein
MAVYVPRKREVKMTWNYRVVKVGKLFYAAGARSGLRFIKGQTSPGAVRERVKAVCRADGMHPREHKGKL